MAVTRAVSARVAFLSSWGFGIAWLAIACMWMRVFGPIPFIALVLIEGAVLGVLGAWAWWWRVQPWRMVVVPASWVVIEAIRSAVPFGGFAWAQLSHSQGTGTWLLGYLPWLGSWGLSALIVALGMGLVEGTRLARTHPRVWPRLIGCTAGLVLLGLGLRLYPAPFTQPTGNPLLTAIVQAGDVRRTFAAGISAIQPRDQRVVDHLSVQHQALNGSQMDLIVWPENSLDSDPDTSMTPGLQAARDALLAEVGQATVFAGQNDHNTEGQLTNAIGVYQHRQRIGTITKAKLVPFGEFFPYPELLSWVPSAQLIGHMVPGAGPDAVLVGSHLVGAVICYESAYADMVSQALATNAGVLVVSTNNASFADTAMKDQHLTISRIRAIEYGRPVAHGSLSGPSAFITPDGRMSPPTRYLDGGVITQALQARTGFTPAAYVNPVLPWMAGLLVGLVTGWRLVRSRA